ncbi:MAG: radical SAM protein [Lentisphaeria bacterium]|nr:radical SAM protein [Lentisphaeria bacterium]
MRAYLEITTICNRSCSFCAGTGRKKEFLAPEKFEERLKKVLPVTHNIFLHLMGEPLLHPDFEKIGAVCKKYNAKATLVTNGTLLAGKEELLFNNPAFSQINFSLHALQKDSLPDRKILEMILSFCEKAEKIRPDLYINLRLWNQQKREEEKTNSLNTFLLEAIGKRFPLPPQEKLQFSPGRKSKHLSGRIYLNMDTVFQWPETEKDILQEKGYCHGMRDQFGILTDGRLVPCCLDTEGKASLGNIDMVEDIQEILSSPEAESIRKGFEKGIAVKEFCKKCSFRTRFKK